ncbi:TrbI/VirB10 family protein [Sphingobium yanoikuyae]|uniref:TrbI/VirB10 family protein n=1 Tax=Sphingobium yanoikuyae TaxID=13690 RepID=UPI0035B4A75D
MSVVPDGNDLGDQVEDQGERDARDDSRRADIPNAANGDPFRLRADPPRVVRLSRKAIALLAGAGCVGLAGTLIYALRPTTLGRIEQQPVSQGHIRADTIASAPDDYAKIPKLGAPLPGDLGRPILSAQQQASANGGYQAQHANGRPTAQQDERERQRGVREAAISSKLFLASASTVTTVAVSEQARQTDGAMTITPGSGVEDQAIEPRATGAARSEFLKPVVTAKQSAERLTALASPYVVQAGTVIPAALITGIRSDLPGLITAQVTENVYDSPSGRVLLIPQGSRLIGEYDSATAAGQTRILLAWDRLIFSDGRSILLDRLQGVDPSGRSGLQDGVDNHWAGLLAAAFISTLLNVGTEVMADDDGSLVRALRYGTQDSISQAGRQIVGQQLSISPTLTIRPGHPLRVMVKRDIILEPAAGRN